MSPTALALVLTAALLHAAWNFAAKKAGGDACFALFSNALLVAVWAPVGLWAARGVVVDWGWREWGVVLASAVVNLVYLQTLLRGYRLADLTVVYPVARGTGPLLSSVGAVLFFGEHPGIVGIAGVLAITLGIFLTAGRSLFRSNELRRRDRARAGVLWGAVTGAAIAGYTLIDGYAVKTLVISPLLITWLGNVFRVPLLTLLLPIARDPSALYARWRMQWRYALVSAVFAPIGYSLVLYAVQRAPLSHVAPAREVSMLFATLFGGRWLGEGDRGWRIAGAVCIGVGVAALAVA